MVSLTNDLIHNPTSQDLRDQFVLSLRELLESIHQIQGIIRNGPSLTEEPEPPAGDLSEIHPEEPQSTSTPHTVQERMTRKRIEQLKGQSHYIGSLGGASRGKTSRRVLPTPPTRTGGTQVCVCMSLHIPLFITSSLHHAPFIFCRRLEVSMNQISAHSKCPPDAKTRSCLSARDSATAMAVEMPRHRLHGTGQGISLYRQTCNTPQVRHVLVT